jgi:NADPH:quinone reductase
VTKLVKVPSNIAPETVLGSLLMGMTALAMTRESYEVKHGDTILVHAAAGGVGMLLCQLCRELGATVIGTASTKEKCDAALAAGATHMINYKEQEDWVTEVMKRAPQGVNCV